MTSLEQTNSTASTTRPAWPRCANWSRPASAARSPARPSSPSSTCTATPSSRSTPTATRPTSLAWLAKTARLRRGRHRGLRRAGRRGRVPGRVRPRRRARQRRHRDARLHPGVRHARDQLAGRAGRLLPHGHRLHLRAGARARPRRSWRRCAPAPSGATARCCARRQRAPGSRRHRLRARRAAADPGGQRHRAPHAGRVHPRPPTKHFPDRDGLASPSGPRSWAASRRRSPRSSATTPSSRTWCAAS